MLDQVFNEVYTKFKLHFYKAVFGRFQTREASLTTVETFCMEIIMALDAPTVNEFSSFLGISAPNAAYKINNLIQKGYVRKEQSESDKREYHLVVTQKYIDYYNISYRYVSKVVERVKERFPPEDVAKMESRGLIPADLHAHVEKVSSLGGTPLVVCENNKILGVIYLKDTVKPGMTERFERLRAIGIKTIMCTGDNPLTAATIAKEAGVDGFIAECKPEDKIDVIKKEQAEGKIVAMTGDGTNDAPALAQANVGLAMNSGTTAAKEAANMVDLDSDPTKILEVVEIGKQLLITRGSLTTFSIANDIAKYFAIIPAMFMMAIPQLSVLNIMRLATPYSAILSALIFNAIIIPCLIPLAMKGVKYRPMSSGKLLARNMLIYGLGGVITPFVGIKIIDTLIAPMLTAIGMVGF